ncbi:MAG: VTT domain-containing protein [Ferruginibacter sp.]|nr:VTT domain-containing protein [Cytophagales bacterium]
MNRYAYLFLFFCLFAIATFVLFDAAGITLDGLLKNQESTFTLALVSVLLLGVDVVLPVPSSVVMLSNGVFFGFALGGVLSVAGGLLSAAVGYWIGRRGQRLAQRFSTPADEQRARGFLEKYGYLAVVISRPIPILAESIAILSGTLPLDFRKVFVSSLLGLLPVAFIYSFAGAYSTSFDNAGWAFLLNLAVAGLIWLVTRGREREV